MATRYTDEFRRDAARGYPSLSAAAKGVAVAKDGSHPSLNGWLYWKAKFPGEARWRSLHEMRDEV